MQQIKIILKIALGLKTVGLINIQFAIKDDTVYIVEVWKSPGASHCGSFFIAKRTENLVCYAAKVMLGHNRVTLSFLLTVKGICS
jgi:carbamoyl-phosphate synthase large subunit